MHVAMPLPMFERDWQFNVNQALPWTSDRATTKRKYIWALKNSMATIPSHPWQVVRSCDASSVANSDLWTDYTKINWSGTNNGGGNRSWCVLRQTAISPYFEMCIGHLWHGYYQYDYAQVWSLHFCPGGYDLTTGNLTTRPSPKVGAAEHSVFDTGNLAGGQVDWNYVLHYMQSSDGLSSRAFFCQNGRVLGWLFVDVPKDMIPTAGQWPSPAVFNYQESTNYNDPDYMHGDVTVLYQYYVGSQTKTQFAGPTNAALYMSGEGIRDNSILNQGNWDGISTRRYWHGPSDWTGEWPMLPIGLVSQTGGKRGRVGRMVDLWWGSRCVPTGAKYNTSSYAGKYGRFIQLGHMISPWPDDTASVLV